VALGLRATAGLYGAGSLTRTAQLAGSKRGIVGAWPRMLPEKLERKGKPFKRRTVADGWKAFWQKRLNKRGGGIAVYACKGATYNRRG